ncbi:ABC transporter substrate-binding protein [Bradyrhizobium sp. NP1]|uniref:ABC transporter substrate-binding protein n=1 Tax=Bradyrhizobium sp. NP1 TaxID=3049772 RepID=UPI0025A676EC|nr:ABC transporter substrate-binding protein [Bradyrhizobium sp. NP1]WJR80939.1 ABC transporter substrate-binding protein [Bradyrhizobium sp. NP1]
MFCYGRVYSIGISTMSAALLWLVAAVPLRAQTAITVAMPTAVLQPLTAYYTSIPATLFWKEEGLDVTILALSGANTAAQALDANRAQVAFTANTALFSLLQAYPDTNLVAFYTFIQNFQSMPRVLPDSPVKTVGDLEGKTVGLQSLGNSQVQTTKALVKQAGKDPNSIKFVAVGEGAEAAYALKTGRVDALALFDGLYALIEAEGTPMRKLESDAASPDRVGFQSSIFTKRSYLEQHRDVLVKLGRGVAKATIFAEENPEAAVRIHWKVYPATRARGSSDEQAMRLSLATLRARLKNVTVVDGLIGNASRDQIAGYMQLIIDGGVLKQPLDIDKLWTPSLLKEINDFDKEAVRRMAREWKP